jgi:hypothetical protein
MLHLRPAVDATAGPPSSAEAARSKSEGRCAVARVALNRVAAHASTEHEAVRQRAEIAKTERSPNGNGRNGINQQQPTEGRQS